MNNYFEIYGGNQLKGEVVNQTSKNATLPILTSMLLIDGEVELLDYPKISDVDNMMEMLKKLGVVIKYQGRKCFIDATNADNLGLDSKLSKTMRSSIFLLGSALARFRNVMITMPGGCNIGKRPIDIHLNALKKLGVKICCLGDNIFFDSSNARANKIKLKIPSVGATENIIQFACKLKGKTTIINAAKEPEVVDLCNFLNLAGANIIGAGTDKITIYGVNKLEGVVYQPIGDRIVAGSIMGAVAMCGGNVVIKNGYPYQNEKFIKILSSMGCQINIKNGIIHIISNGILNSAGKISTGFYPKFPTDLQSIMLAISTTSNGKTLIEENVFENRFLVVEELKKMGAIIDIIDNKHVSISGVDKLQSTDLIAKDLRGGMALILAALKTDGKTNVYSINFIDRGYERIEEVFVSLGANIRRV